MRSRDNNAEEDETEMTENGKFDRQRGEREEAERANANNE